MKIYLGRHGETPWNKEHRAQGAHDIALNESGLRLAHETAAGLKAAGVVFDRAYASPLIRAYETASIIYEETGARNASGELLSPLTADPRIREFSFGSCEGCDIRGVENDPDHPMYTFLYDPSRNHWAEDSETFEEVRTRFRDFIETTILPLEGTCENVLVLCHGGVMREALDWITNRPRRGYMPTASEFRNCSFHIIECTDGKLTVTESGRVYYE